MYTCTISNWFTRPDVHSLQLSVFDTQYLFCYLFISLTLCLSLFLCLCLSHPLYIYKDGQGLRKMLLKHSDIYIYTQRDAYACIYINVYVFVCACVCVFVFINPSVQARRDTSLIWKWSLADWNQSFHSRRHVK